MTDQDERWLTCPFCSGAIHKERNAVAYNRLKCPRCNTEYPYPLREIRQFVDGRYVISYLPQEKSSEA